jgi:hypothetical protein
LNVLSGKIEFATKIRNKYKITFPFQIVLQTSSKKIETYCKDKWPDLMRDTSYTMTQLSQLQMMKSYIKKNISTSDWNDIIKHFQVKGWFSPLNPPEIVSSSIDITDSTCKFWSDPNTPYLTIYGRLAIDIEKVVDIYIKKKYFAIKKFSDSMIKQIAQTVYNQSLPMILTYDGHLNYNNEIMEIVKALLSKDSELTKQLSKELNIKDIAKAKKDFQWIGNNIHVTISDWKHMIKKNAIPVALGGLYLLQNNKKKKLDLLNQQIDIYSSMLDVLEQQQRKS